MSGNGDSYCDLSDWVKNSLGPGKNPIEKMEKICRSNMRKLWKSSALKHCPKLGSWKRRSTGLINEITRVQNICLKRRTGLKCEIIERLSVSRVKCLNRYRRGLETCPKVKTFKNERSATTLFSSLFSDESERPV